MSQTALNSHKILNQLPPTPSIKTPCYLGWILLLPTQTPVLCSLKHCKDKAIPFGKSERLDKYLGGLRKLTFLLLQIQMIKELIHALRHKGQKTLDSGACLKAGMEITLPPDQELASGRVSLTTT